MALPASGRHVAPVNRGPGIGRSVNAVRTVTAGTVGRHQESALRQGPTMNRVHEELISVGDRYAMTFGQRGVTMARTAGPREIERIDSRLRVLSRLDVVTAMATDAGGSILSCHGRSFAVDTFGVIFCSFDVAGRALNRL